MTTFRSHLIYGLHKMGLFGALDRCRDYVKLAYAAKQRTFSQFGEDLFLKEYFGDRKGIYIEVGGNHPFTLSNTYLLYRMGWRGLIVEPIHKLYAKHKRFRPRDIQVQAVASGQAGNLTFYEMIPSVLSTCDRGEAENMLSAGSARLLRKYSVPAMTVEELYREHLAPSPILLLSVDTEGHDMDVLRGVDWEGIHPEVVICEANDEVHGRVICEFLYSHGYECIKTLGCNRVFSLTCLPTLPHRNRTSS